MSESNETRTIRPTGDRILVRQKAYTDKLESGLYIPQGNRAGYEDRGEVVAIGPKVTADVKVGDTVIFKRQPASALLPDARESDSYGWKNFLMLKEANVLAVIED